MKKIETIGSKISELSKELWQLMRDIPPDCIQQLNEISEIYGLQNQVAALSNSSVANTLMQTIKRIACACRESNHETMCKYLKQAIEDLASGMNATELLWKYDTILCNLQHKGELKKTDMLLKEIHWYEQCNKNKGDKCEHSRCKYCVLTLGQGSELFCGRKSL